MDFKNWLPVITSVLLLHLFAFSASAQSSGNNYDAEWNKVKNFEEKGLTTSAIHEVNSIYQRAKKDRNQTQVIKSLLYKYKLSQNITEDATKKMIDTLQQEIRVAPEPAKSILQSITAQLYQNYFSNNRYRLYSVSNTEDFQKNDIATWSANDFIQKISTLFLASLENPDLKKIELKPFDAIIEKGNVRYLRPTLFDLLAHRALDFFKNTANDIARPSFGFEVSDPVAFAPAKKFVDATLKAKDSTSMQLHALQVFQELIRLHLQEVKPLMDVDLERLQFVHHNAVMADKDELYKQALKFIFENNTNAAAQAGFLWAQQTADVADVTNLSGRGDSVKKSVRILQQVIAKFPGSEGATNAKNALAQVEQPALSVETEKVNSINKAFRALVTYKNLHQLYLRVVPVTKKQKDDLRRAENQADRFRQMAAMKQVKEWSQGVPDIRDFLEHRVEIKIDGLPTGEYILLASRDKDFGTGKNVMSANYFYVSDISYINNGKNFFVLDRESGKPIANAEVGILLRNYNYKTRKYDHSRAGNANTDQHGFFRIPANIQNDLYNLRLDISTGNDRLYLDDEQRIYSYRQNLQTDYADQQEMDEDMARIFFFTDRSIYRPGQKVYFKGIGVTMGLKDRRSILLKAGSLVKIFFNNANGEPIDSLQLKLNDFGSVNGSFTIPQNQLTGGFSISSADYSNSNVYFTVEEYKRPKFFAEFNPVKQTYRVNDTVHITGKAEAYAGNRVDGAHVTYRVQRMARFIYPWRFWKIGFPRISPMEIAHGETTTDENGLFAIDFQAIPDRQLDPDNDPIFDYQVTADITDINGETRSASITVPVGYKALNLQIELINKGTYTPGEVNTILISAKNLSGEPQQVASDIRIYKLQTPDRTLRERLWQEPDTFVMSKAAYVRDFPHDIYKDEDNPETWERSKMIFEKTDSVKGSLSIRSADSFQTGWYVIEATSADRFGNNVRDVRYFRVLQPQEKGIHLPDYLVSAADKQAYEPGDTAIIYLGTASDIYLIQEKDTVTNWESDTIPQFNITELHNESRAFMFPVSDQDRGGFGVLNFFVKNSRLYFTKSIVDVPWRNKKLDITFDTYREKTLPGSRETWKVTVAGPKGDVIAAEMLASMYDASLDQFKPHTWRGMDIWPVYRSFSRWQGQQNFVATGSFTFAPSPDYISTQPKQYDHLQPLPSFRTVRFAMAAGSARKEISADMKLEEVVMEDSAVSAPLPGYESADSPAQEQPQTQQPVRTNFNETAFFYPELKTDKQGNISFSFTIPEALTTWRLMTQAHTRDLAIGYAEKSVITQKDLMIVPNVPRFLREGDRLEFSAKVVNMTAQEIQVNVDFHLLNAATGMPVDTWFKNNISRKIITVGGNQSVPVSFPIEIPKGFNDMVVYRITAGTGSMSDGEEAYIPVVTNRMLVTETMPLEMKGAGTKTFSFDNLIQSGSSSSLANYGLTVEYTPNPAWYAIQALPYLNSYPYECTEQVFNRYFANALAMNIANSSPKVKAIFEKWKDQDTSALLSNLQKNQELKSVLLEETPWVLQANSEEQQKKNIALLFDVVNMSGQLDGALQTVKERQSPNGGFVWLKNGPDDRYMTQYIVADIGHLKKLNALPARNRDELKRMVEMAIPYLDNRMAEDYEKLKKSKSKLDDNHLSPIIAHYLYTRSFFPDIVLRHTSKEAYNYYITQAKKLWLKQSVYSQGLLALALYRSGEQKYAGDIVESLRQNAIVNDGLGMYWKACDQRSWWWYQAPVESQALMIEVFSEIAKDEKAVGELKTWLLKNKQTNNWKTTKATAEAVYALLLRGADWLSAAPDVRIKLGNITFDNKEEKQEAGTGYFKRRIDGSQVKPGMGKISVTVSQPAQADQASPSWGAVYWQYFEDLDKIGFASTPLQVSKKLFVEKLTDRGAVLTPVRDADLLHVGDKIKVRIELRVDRDMEYVHMKDMRASSMEPVNVLSSYKWQGGLGYYESTKDVSTNFFFNYLPKGTYVFEYPMFVTHSGNFSNGITTIQSMYAPEFTAHSEGVRITVR